MCIRDRIITNGLGLVIGGGSTITNLSSVNATNSIYLSGNLTSLANASPNVIIDPSGYATFQLDGSRTFDVANGAADSDLTMAINITNGVNAGAITKTGLGTLTLSGNNGYTGGTTVGNGTLLVNNAAGSGTGAGAVSVANGATLGGSGAIAGSTLPLKRELVAKLLGFVNASGKVQLTQNSMDAVSDRDFMIEFAATAALLAVHISRLAEDVILWVSAEFNYIKIADAYTTGSSLMPQKKNPDIAELARGKTGRVVGNLMALLTLLKGLPMTYNRDLQEDKERLFDTADTVRATTRLMAAMLKNTKVNKTACAAAASDPALLATDLADYLVRKGMPFRQAHHVVGAVVALAEKTGKTLNQLKLAELQTIDKTFGRDALSVFNLKTAMAKRNITGAPGTKEVAKQLARWREQLS